jgi:hypothetical protein
MRKPWLLILLFCIGCNTDDKQAKVTISLVNHKQALSITGVDPVIMQDINRDTASNWQTLFAVYRMPADTDMKDYQPMQPGKYLLKDSVLTFTPDTAFAPSKTYFLRYYNYGAGKSIADYIKGKAKPNQLRYTDLIFKR